MIPDLSWYEWAALFAIFIAFWVVGDFVGPLLRAWWIDRRMRRAFRYGLRRLRQ